jgi:NTE family protein
MYKIGYTLSGGGARGIAHLGILQALNELNIKPEIISGASAGAIVGAFYASGYSPIETLEIILESRLLSFFKPQLKGLGLFDMNNFLVLYNKYFPHNSFEGLKLPLIVAATDLYENKTVYFSSGELINPILASSAIPIVFDPICFNNMLMVDGGILDNLPVAPLCGKCKKIIGVHVNAPGKHKEIKSKRSIIEKSFYLAIYSNVRNNLDKCDIVIEPPDMANYTIYDIAHANEMFDIGYFYTMEIKDKILSELEM